MNPAVSVSRTSGKQDKLTAGQDSADTSDDAMLRVKASIKNQCYREASDLLASTQAPKEDSPEQKIIRLTLELRCQLALSNLDKARLAWSDLEDIFKSYSDLRTTNLMILGTRLFFACGDMDKAIECSKAACEVAVGSDEAILSQSMLSRMRYLQEGDACTVEKELMPHWAALKVDRSYGEESQGMTRYLQTVLATAAIACGKLHLVHEMFTHKEQPKTIHDLELQMLKGVACFSAGDKESAIRLAQDADHVCLSDGTCRQEHGLILWRQAWIFHAARLARETQIKAEDFHALTSTCNHKDFQPHADLLLASCLIQRGNLSKASILVEKYFIKKTIGEPDQRTSQALSRAEAVSYEISPKLNVQLKALLVACEALLQSSTFGSRHAYDLLKRHQDILFDKSARMTLSLMCHAHKDLLLLLCKTFGVVDIPLELTDLLDTRDFEEIFMRTESQLQQRESLKFQERFPFLVGQNTRVDYGRHSDSQPVQLLQRSKPLEIKLFGGLELKVAGQTLNLDNWGNSKTRSLFVSLALAAGSEFAREVIIEKLWPEQPYKVASGMYNVTWCQMRKRILNALPKESAEQSELILDAFHNSGGRCVLRADEVQVDVKQFEDLNAQLADLLREGKKDACLLTIKRMTEIYTGDLLPGDCYLDWLNLERRHYRKIFVETILLGVDICLNNNEPESALYYLHLIDLSEGDSEELYYLSMRAYAALGRREEAISVFHKCRCYLREEFGLDPSHQMATLHQQLLCASA